MRLGVQFADGRRAATTGDHSWPGDKADRAKLILIPGSSDTSWDGGFWVRPPGRP